MPFLQRLNLYNRTVETDGKQFGECKSAKIPGGLRFELGTLRSAPPGTMDSGATLLS